MATQQDLANYVASVRSRLIDVDGVFGAQCWDQWSSYAQWLGVPAGPTYTNAGGTSPHSGYACNVYHNARSAGLGQWFEILPASAIPHPGDVAFWEFGSAWYPLSHVATVLEPPSKGALLRCLTQNPGHVQVADLIMRGIIGYLRPRGLTIGAVDISKTPTLTASQKQEDEDIMALYFEASANSSPIRTLPSGSPDPSASRIWAGDGRVIDGTTYSGVWERSEDGSIRRLFKQEWEGIVSAYAAAGRRIPLARVHGNAIEQMYLVKRAEPTR